MKISFMGLDLTEGKVKYKDARVEKLVEKFSPKKIVWFFAEFIKENFSVSDAIVVLKEKALDLLILDMEKLEARLSNTQDLDEKQLLQKCLSNLEQEIPLCNLEFNEKDLAVLKVLAPFSLKPTLFVTEIFDINSLIAQLLEKAKLMFFYTAGKKEVHPWCVRKNSSALTCAAKIHSDLARGFIKAEVVSFADFMGVYNMQEAKAKGIVKIVDKEYLIADGDILEIRFNV